ncbi:MAG: DUF2156 domain-containing protein [Cryobacterium sp.]|nr:DUF2156 domain-containing protein [Oligoflexia bacterium]
MPMIGREEAYSKFKRLGFNSSHFVWFLADLKFFETSKGYVFGFAVVGDVTLFALEPLAPDPIASFSEAWDEVCREISPKISAFISVYDPFLTDLKPHGFRSVKIGSEPWVKLTEWMPSGNSGKGVRSARNHAVKAGVRVEEWVAGDLEHDQKKRELFKEIYADWSSEQWLKLSGFTLATDAFQRMSDRRYFVVKSPEKIEGYLVASPVPKTRSYYLEDIILRRNAPKGSGELLTLEAMGALNRDQAYEASLGVVATANSEDEAKNTDLPPLVRFLLVTVPSQLSAFYNAEGMELYRKRFKPHRWADINLAVRCPEGMNETVAWLKSFFALFRAFKPRLNISARLIRNGILRPLRRYPVTITVCLVSVAVFLAFNHGGTLQDGDLSRFGFVGLLPMNEWFFRSVVSDFFYSGAFHFYTCFIPFACLLAWSEKTQRRSFFLALVALASVFDDFVNYAVVIWPFKHYHPSIFGALMSEKQVGGSLLMALLLGLQITRFQKNRELLFVVTSLITVLAIVFVTGEIHILLLNLNHFVFLSFGFAIGKLKFEWERNQSRKHAKDRTPKVSSEPDEPLPRDKAA